MKVEKMNTGLIFKNKEKTGQQPDYSGSCNINGEQLRIALWINENDRGKYLSAKFSEQREQQEDNAIGMPQKNSITTIDSNEDIPF